MLKIVFLLYPSLLSMVMRTSLHSIRSSTITWASTLGNLKPEQTMILTSRRKSSEIVSQSLSELPQTPSKQLSSISEISSTPTIIQTALAAVETSSMPMVATLKSLKSVSTLNYTPLNLPLPSTSLSQSEICREIMIHTQAWHLMRPYVWHFAITLGFTLAVILALFTSGVLGKF